MTEKKFRLYSEDLKNGWELVKVSGEIDADSGLYFQDYLEKMLSLKRFHIVVDLEETSYVNSRGIGILSYFLRECQEHGGNLVLLKPNKKVMALLKITFLTKLFNIIDDISELEEVYNQN